MVKLFNQSSDLAEILRDDAYEGPRRTEGIIVRLGSRFLPPGGVFSSNFVLGHISAAYHYIFTKFGVYLDNGVLPCEEWSKYGFLHNPRWRMVAILNYLTLDTVKVAPDLEFCRRGAFSLNFVLGYVSVAGQDIFIKFGVYVGEWGSATCGMVQICFAP